MIRNLPAWARSKVAVELLAAIARDRPEPRVRQHRLSATFGGYSEGTSISYPGKIAGTLRTIQTQWVQREYAALDRRFAVTHRWDHEQAREILSAESADALIERVLRESGEQRRAA
jgi:hypothetical protein